MDAFALTAFEDGRKITMISRGKSMPDGFYVGYMSASSGYGMALFVFHGTTIVGVDVGGVKFDGTFTHDTETGGFHGSIRVDAPPNISLIQGAQTGPKGIKYTVPFSLPANFLETPFLKIETPFGVVNVRLEKLRDLQAAQ